jgi:RNA polymerase sigma-70 factor (ECF subfamily)
VKPSAAGTAGARRFEELVRAHEPILFAMALKLCGNGADARDLVQDAFERALRGYAQLGPDANERAWVITIMHNLFIDRCRRRKREPRTEPVDETSVAAAEPTPPPPAWTDITSEQLRAALGQLSEEFRVVYQLHAIDGRSYKEIAVQLDLPLATVGTRLIRARRKLRDVLESMLGRAPEEP